MVRTVKVIAHKANSALVEFAEDGIVFRRVVPYSAINKDKIEDKTLLNGAPYGVDFSTIDLDRLTVGFKDRLIKAFRDRNLWTREDFERNPTLVRDSLLNAINADVASIMNLIQAQE